MVLLLLLLSFQTYILSTWSVNTKQGMCVSPKSPLCSDKDVLTSPTWTYGWGKKDKFGPSQLNCNPSPTQEFVPMFWGHKSTTVYTTDMIEPGAQYILGFNEPNRKDQANLEPAEALEGWLQIRDVFGATHTLVSPSATNCGATSGKCVTDFPTHTEWFDEFFRLCNNTCDTSVTPKVCTNDCGIEYLATHAYKGAPSQVINFVTALYNAYGYKVWLTEFAYWGSGGLGTVADQQAFMEDVLPLLDASDAVFRYAWFSTRHAPGKSDKVWYLFPFSDYTNDPSTGSHLNALGTAYQDHVMVTAARAYGRNYDSPCGPYGPTPCDYASQARSRSVSGDGSVNDGDWSSVLERVRVRAVGVYDVLIDFTLTHPQIALFFELIGMLFVLINLCRCSVCAYLCCCNKNKKVVLKYESVGHSTAGGYRPEAADLI